MDIIYSVNGAYFKEFGVNVESSSGFGALKRKEPENYDFPDQNGSSPDLTNPYYEQREMKFECWIKGNNWQHLYNNFQQFIKLFQQSGTQRLVIEYPPIATTRVYQVYLSAEVELKSRIKKGVLFAKFDLRLIEPNPIKKIFIAYGAPTNAILKYNSPEETQIFLPNGVKYDVHSNADMTVNLSADNSVSYYNYKGRNLLRRSWEVVSQNVQKIDTNLTVWGGRNWYFYYDEIYFEEGSNSIITIEFRPTALQYPSVFLRIDVNDYNNRSFEVFLPENNIPYEVFLHNRNAGSPNNGAMVYLSGASLYKDKLDFWNIAPEDAKFVVIAGNISKLSNVLFSGGLLWNEL